jgi:hypothetical protein
MGLFTNKQVYATKWTVKESYEISAEDQALFIDAEVVPSEYGMSVKFNMVGGGCCYIPCDTESVMRIGDKYAPHELEVVILQRLGDADIERIRPKKA